jgi:hypothetical protein
MREKKKKVENEDKDENENDVPGSEPAYARPQRKRRNAPHSKGWRQHGHASKMSEAFGVRRIPPLSNSDAPFRSQILCRSAYAVRS